MKHIKEFVEFVNEGKNTLENALNQELNLSQDNINVYAERDSKIVLSSKYTMSKEEWKEVGDEVIQFMYNWNGDEYEITTLGTTRVIVEIKD